MRILYLDYTNAIGLGGGQRSLSLLVRYLDRARFQPLVACPPDEKLRELLDRDVPVLPLPMEARFRQLSRDQTCWSRLPGAAAMAVSTVSHLRRLIRREQIELIHANNLKMLLVASAAAPSLPKIWHVRDIYPQTRPVRRVLEVACRLSARILTVSEAVARHLPDRSKATVLYNAIELPPFRPATPREQNRIGYVGRLDRWKGLDTLLDAFRLVRRKWPQARLLVIGDGPEASRVRQPFVEHLPFRTNLAPVWDLIDIAVTPSTEPDPFPRAVIEAMGYAKPVVGSALGGIPEAIEDGTTGFLFPAGSARSLAARLDALLASPDRATQMGRAGRRRCEDLFSVESQAAALGSIYDSLAVRQAAA